MRLNIKINKNQLYDEINLIKQYVTRLRNDCNCIKKIWDDILKMVDVLEKKQLFEKPFLFQQVTHLSTNNFYRGIALE